MLTRLLQGHVGRVGSDLRGGRGGGTQHGVHLGGGRGALVSKLRGFSMKLEENGESTAMHPQRASRLGFIARWWLTLLYVWVRV